jgi:uncharacterized membrane protein YfcA
MLFPTSGVEVNPLIPFLTAIFVSFFTSMGGLSGAFLLLPFQVSILGYTAPSISATNQVFNVVAIPSGVYRYVREGRMLWPLTWTVIIGTLPGVFIGAWVRIKYLPNPKDFKFFVGFILLYIGWRLLLDVVRFKNKQKDKDSLIDSVPSQAVDVKVSTMRNVKFEYDGETFEFSPPMIYVLCFFVGIIGGIYGIGGGAIIAPFFVVIVGLPVYIVAGASLMGTFITSAVGVIFYQFLAQFYPDISVAPDWSLGILFGVGGFLGMYLGARTQKYVPAKYIKGMLCACVMFVAGDYILSFFM